MSTTSPFDEASEYLRNSASKSRLVMLVGAGASMDPPASLPNWRVFAERMIAEVRKVQPARAELMADELSRGNFIEVGTLFESLVRNRKEEFFQSQFDRPTGELPPIYKTIARLPVAHWLTTNYDPFLWYAVGEREPAAERCTATDESLKIALNQWSRKKCVVYLHGHATNYDAIVYSGPTYQRLQKLHTYRELLKRIFAESTVLAYGYSCTDPDVLETLRFIVEQLGGITESRHYLLTTSRPASSDLDLFTRANIEILQYSSDNSHQAAKRFLQDLTQVGASNQPDVLPSAQGAEMQGLVRIFLSLQDPQHRAGSYQRACAALVVKALSGTVSASSSDLHAKLIALAHVDYQTADRMAAEGMSLLARYDVIDVTPTKISLRNTLTSRWSSNVDEVVAAVETRVRTYNSSYQPNASTKAAIQRMISHVMLAQGMTIARSLLNEEDVAGYDLERLLEEAARLESHVPCASDVVKATAEILRSPDSGSSGALFSLAEAAYALELLFLNPREPAMGTVLNWKIFVDSNVVLRALSPQSPFHKDFRKLLERCRRIGTPLAILYPIAEECVEQVAKVGALLRDLKLRKLAEVRAYSESLDAVERSPILDWFLVELSKKGTLSFEQFTKSNRIDNIDRLADLLWSTLGIRAEEKDIKARLDTGERETLWADLRGWRNDKSIGGRILRRNEATQVVWMMQLRTKGVRAWFLSEDAHLRRALMSLRGGQYAGFVVPPTALSHHLNQLHWGELDTFGFSALMWSYPRRSPRDRATDMILRRIAEESVAKGIEVERLRDSVEGVLAEGRFDVVLPADVDTSDSVQEAEFLRIMDHLVPKATSQILDDLVRKGSRRG